MRNTHRLRGRRTLPLTAALWIAPLGFLALFYFYPMMNILAVSFQRGETGLAAPFIQALTSPSMRGVLWFTLWQATLSTALTLLLGLPGAYLIARYRFRGKSLFRALTAIPFVLPTVVVAAGFNALLGPQGWVNLAWISISNWLGHPMQVAPIQFMYTLPAILLAHVFYNTTIVLRMVGDFWAHLDPRIEQAAAVLGANRWQRLRHVTLPLLAPSIAAAALLVFIFDFTSFGVILILGGPRFATLEVEIYNQTINLFNLPLAGALSLIQLACTLVFTILYTRLNARVTRPVSLRPQQFTQRKLSGWRRLLAYTYLAGLLVFFLSPLVALALRSVVTMDARAISHSGFTLDFYRELGINRRQSIFFATPLTAIGVSLVYATTTAALALLLGLAASWALARNGRSKMNRLLDPLLMLPLGTSAVTLGLGFIIALDRPPLNLRTSPVLIPLAHTLVALPFVVRSLTPALTSIRPRLRHAAQVMGANPLQVFRHIDLPLGGRAVLVAAAFAFSVSLGEFGATALISRPEYPTIPVAIYRLITQPGAMNYGQAMALSTILMLVTALGILAIERLRIAEIGEF